MLAKSLGNRKIVENRRKIIEKSSKVLDFFENLKTSIFPSLFKNRKLHLEKYLFHFNYLNCTFTWIGAKLELLNVPNAETTLLEFSSEFLVGEKWLSSERSGDWSAAFLRILYEFMVSCVLEILIIINYLYSPWQFYTDILYLFRFGVCPWLPINLPLT